VIQRSCPSPGTLTLLLALADGAAFSAEAHPGAASVKVRFAVPDRRPPLEIAADLYRPAGEDAPMMRASSDGGTWQAARWWPRPGWPRPPAASRSAAPLRSRRHRDLVIARPNTSEPDRRWSLALDRISEEENRAADFNTVIERDPDTNPYVGTSRAGQERMAKGKPWTSCDAISKKSWACFSRTGNRSSNPSSSVCRRFRSHGGGSLPVDERRKDNDR
jgi:hypothetical protein